MLHQQKHQKVSKINIIISNVKVSDLKKTLTLLNIKLQTKNNSKHLSKWIGSAQALRW